MACCDRRRSRSAGVLGSAADGAVASRHADHGADELQRNGELFGQPRITFQSREASETERSSYRIAVAQMLKQCASLPFTEALGNTVAGQPPHHDLRRRSE